MVPRHVIAYMNDAQRSHYYTSIYDSSSRDTWPPVDFSRRGFPASHASSPTIEAEGSEMQRFYLVYNNLLLLLMVACNPA